MAKKDFNKNAMESLVSGLTSPVKESAPAPSSSTAEQRPSSGGRRGRPSTRQENEVISTVVNKDKINKARAIAGIEGIAIKDIIDKGLDMVIKVYEEKHGPVRPRRPKKKGDVDEVFGV